MGNPTKLWFHGFPVWRNVVVNQMNTGPPPCQWPPTWRRDISQGPATTNPLEHTKEYILALRDLIVKDLYTPRNTINDLSCWSMIVSLLCHNAMDMMNLWNLTWKMVSTWYFHYGAGRFLQSERNRRSGGCLIQLQCFVWSGGRNPSWGKQAFWYALLLLTFWNLGFG